MEERNKMSEIHRIVMNYYKFTTTTNFANEEDEKSYTQDLLDEIGKIVNLLPIHDVMHCEVCNDVHDVRVICKDCITDYCNDRV
jgi:hypothetical protein